MSPPLSSIAYIYFTISSTFTLIPSIIMTLKNLFKTRKSGVGWGYRTRKSRVGWGHRGNCCAASKLNQKVWHPSLSLLPQFFFLFYSFSPPFFPFIYLSCQ
uniref:Uncharacterized protein n=1 Tax=Cacopsylla melanoneura TaxID=428564 RepID=A0A8D9BE42_9HEMI